jgi:hypothetical protein
VIGTCDFEVLGAADICSTATSVKRSENIESGYLVCFAKEPSDRSLFDFASSIPFRTLRSASSFS